MYTDYKNFTVEPLNISFGANIILNDTKLTINFGERYVLVGKNGIGKTSLLDAISLKTIKGIPDIDIIYVKQEEHVLDLPIIQVLLSSSPLYHIQNQLHHLEKLINADIASDDDITEWNKLNIYSSEYSRQVASAHKILSGLGFTDRSIHAITLSGGWRMRLALARALFMTPTLLLLDEPTNHLDLMANIWLCQYLQSYPKTIIMASHDKYFIDNVCTTIINIRKQKLNYYRCHNDSHKYIHFIKQLNIELKKEEKDYALYDKKLKSLKNRGVRKAEIDIFVKKNYISKPERNYQVKITFLQPNIIEEPLVILSDVSIGYDTTSLLTDVNLEIRTESRYCIVGPNGIGKSTLLSLIVGNIVPQSGTIYIYQSLRIGYYNQHFEASLPFHLTPIQYLMGLDSSITFEQSHKYASMFGLNPLYHKIKIGDLSGGQKARVKFASFGIIRPHLLILDEPSNHLDLVTIESLIDALNTFEGGILLVTHNFDMITRLNMKLLNINDKHLNIYKGSFNDYVSSICNCNNDN